MPESTKPELTQARLKELLHYDPETGVFTWRVNRSSRHTGQAAGCPSTGGYHKIRVDRRLYYAHRLAFLYVAGRTPPAEVDHVDRDPTNNRWGNLRLASASENGCNKPAPRTNSSGLKGVAWHRAARKWQAYAGKGGVRAYLGLFDSREAAGCAAAAWRADNHGEFAA